MYITPDRLCYLGLAEPVSENWVSDFFLRTFSFLSGKEDLKEKIMDEAISLLSYFISRGVKNLTEEQQAQINDAFEQARLVYKQDPKNLIKKLKENDAETDGV